ncbi:MAG TPA: 4Fe-4S binding protein [Methanospirillum sp.]|nr:4Fe-4S binding protein [Methanospirillum sp.]
MKEKIKKFVLDLGVEDVGFGAVSDYNSPLSPSVDSIFPKAKSMVVMAYRELSNCESDNQRVAMGGRLDSMEFIRSCNYKVSRFIEKEFNTKAMSTQFSYPLNMQPESRFGLIADFSQRHAAVAAGLGNFGRHNLVIHPRLGSRVIFSTILTELELTPDPKVTEDLCIHCNICVENCPGRALDEEGKTDASKCMKHSQPNGIRGNIKFWMKFIDSSPEEQKKMMMSPQYMSLYQSVIIGFEYHCFKCYTSCPLGQ